MESYSSTIGDENASDEEIFACAAAEQKTPVTAIGDLCVDDEATLSDQTPEMSAYVLVRTRSTQTKFRKATKKPKGRTIGTQTHLTTSSVSLLRTTTRVEQQPEVQAENVNIGKANTDVNETHGITTPPAGRLESPDLDNDDTDEDDDLSTIDNHHEDHDENYDPETASTGSDNSSSEEISEDHCQVLLQGKPAQQQLKLIVFEEAIVNVWKMPSLWVKMHSLYRTENWISV